MLFYVMVLESGLTSCESPKELGKVQILRFYPKPRVRKLPEGLKISVSVYS